jgi:hypothetical protein
MEKHKSPEEIQQIEENRRKSDESLFRHQDEKDLDLETMKWTINPSPDTRLEMIGEMMMTDREKALSEAREVRRTAERKIPALEKHIERIEQLVEWWKKKPNMPYGYEAVIHHQRFVLQDDFEEEGGSPEESTYQNTFTHLERELENQRGWLAYFRKNLEKAKELEEKAE